MPSVAIDSNGNNYVFWKGEDGNLWETVWQGYGWAGPYDLHDGVMGSAPAATAHGNEIDVFWKGGDNGLWEDFYTTTAGWHGAFEIAGIRNLNSAPGVDSRSTGEQDVFWRGTDTNLIEAYWSGGWHGPYDFGMGPLDGAPAAGVQPTSGEVDIYWQSQGYLTEAYWRTSMNGPIRLSQMGHIGSQPTVGIQTSGENDVFWRGADGTLWEGWYANGWNGPLQVASTSLSDAPSAADQPASNRPSSNEQDVYWPQSDGNLHESWYRQGWHGPQISVAPIMGCITGRSGGAVSAQDGWTTFNPQAATTLGGVYASIFVYSPGVSQQSTATLLTIIYPYDGDFAQLGWTEFPGGVRYTYVAVNKTANGNSILHVRPLAPQTPGQYHYYTALWNYQPGDYTFLVDGNTIDQEAYGGPAPTEAQIMGQTFWNSNQMPGGTRANEVITDAHVWLDGHGDGFPANPGWYPFDNYGNAQSQNSSSTAGQFSPTTTQYQIWDSGCQ